MLTQNILLTNLKEFGLNSYEAKLWLSLLSRGISTAGELSDIADVPRSRSYDVLESLEKKGFIIMKLGKPIKYIAVPPLEVIDRIKKKVQEKAEQQEVQLEKMKESNVLEELESLYTKGVDKLDPADLTGAVKGRTNMYAHLNSMIKNAQKSVDIMTTTEGAIRKIQSLKRQLQKAKKRGVKVRMLVPIEDKKIAQEHVDIKVAENADFRMCIIDNKEIFLIVVDDKKVHPAYDFGIWVNTDYFVKGMNNMFDSMWKKGKRL